MFLKGFYAAFVAVLLLVSVPVTAHAFGGAEEQMVFAAFINTVKAEAYDRSCNGAKITGRVKEKGHTANFAKNKQLLTAELTKRLIASTQGDVAGIIQKLAMETDAKAAADFKKNGCYNDDAKASENLLKLISGTEPEFLIESLMKYIGSEAAQAR